MIKRYKKILEEMQLMNKRLESLEKATSQLPSMEKAIRKLPSMEQAIDKLSSDVQDLPAMKQAIFETNDLVKTIEDKVDEKDSEIQVINKRLFRLESKVERILR